MTDAVKKKMTFPGAWGVLRVLLLVFGRPLFTGNSHPGFLNHHPIRTGRIRVRKFFR